jgi:hypothetical protein
MTTPAHFTLAVARHEPMRGDRMTAFSIVSSAPSRSSAGPAVRQGGLHLRLAPATA